MCVHNRISMPYSLLLSNNNTHKQRAVKNGWPGSILHVSDVRWMQGVQGGGGAPLQVIYSIVHSQHSTADQIQTFALVKTACLD